MFFVIDSGNYENAQYLSIHHTHIQRLFFPPFRIQLALMNCPTTSCQWNRTYNHYEWSFQERQGLNIQVQSVHPHISRGKENVCSSNPSSLIAGSTGKCQFLLHISMEDLHSSFIADNKVIYPFCLLTEVGDVNRWHQTDVLGYGRRATAPSIQALSVDPNGASFLMNISKKHAS